MINSKEYDLNSYETRLVVDFFMHHLKGEERRTFMYQFPVIYNKLCGSHIMGVMNLKGKSIFHDDEEEQTGV
jgi:hypothetical protein